MGKGAIRWGSGEEATLRKTVRNFNDKINRVLKRDPAAAAYLPAKKSYAAEKKRAQEGTRKDFQKQISFIQKFSAKGAEKQVTNQLGLNITKWEADKAKELIRRENITRANRRKKISTDVKQGLATEEEKALQAPKKLNLDTKTPRAFQMLVNALEARQTDVYKLEGFEKYKENYIKALDNLGIYGAAIKQAVSKIPAEKLFYFTKNDPTLQIDFVYSANDAEAIFERMVERFGGSGQEWAKHFDAETILPEEIEE